MRITSWNLASAPGTAQEPIPAAATALKRLAPDVILLQQVRDGQMCRQLAEALKPADYQVLVCSAFPVAQNGAAHQVAILARQPAEATRSLCWHSQNGTNLAGGFVFAAIQTEQTRLGLFCVQLDDQLAQTIARPQDRGTAQIQAGAIQQWLEIVESIRHGPTNRIEAAVLAGGFTSHTGATATQNKEAHFANSFLEAALDQVISSTPGKSNDLALNCISAHLTPNSDNLPGIVLSLAPATCDLDLSPAQAVPAQVSALAGPVPSASQVPIGFPSSNAPSLHSDAAPSHAVASKAAQPSAAAGSLSNLAPRPPAMPVATAVPPPKLAGWPSPTQHIEGASLPVSPEHKPPLRPATPLPSSFSPAAKSAPALKWPLITGLGVALILLAFLGLRTKRKQSIEPARVSGNHHPVSPLPGMVATAFQSPPTATSPTFISHPLQAAASDPEPQLTASEKTPASPDWRQRAVAAEQKAEHAEALLRAGLLPQVSQLLKQKLVDKLLTDRAQLLATQQAATLQALQVHERLTRIETQIQQQQQAYERRIDALTRELAAAKEENRQLIRAQIDQVKAEMAAARDRMRAAADKALIS